MTRPKTIYTHTRWPISEPAWIYLIMLKNELLCLRQHHDCIKQRPLPSPSLTWLMNSASPGLLHSPCYLPCVGIMEIVLTNWIDPKSGDYLKVLYSKRCVYRSLLISVGLGSQDTCTQLTWPNQEPNQSMERYNRKWWKPSVQLFHKTPLVSWLHVVLVNYICRPIRLSCGGIIATYLAMRRGLQPM